MKLRSGSSAGWDIIGRRKWWYAISASLLIPAALSIVLFGLKLGIDFTGGSTLELKGKLSEAKITAIASANGAENITLTSGSNGYLLRYRMSEDEQASQVRLQNALKEQRLEVVRFDQIGPSVSRDLAKNAFLAIIFMSGAIVVYITWAFRRVPKEVKPFKFGLATLLAAFAHDALFIIGVFAVLGKLWGIEVDSYIVTAVLTVIGFSIHDTIVVFDRIREKLLQTSGRYDFAELVNRSVNETIVRSLNTSLVIVLVLLALFLFGGSPIRYFTLALLLGMVAGTYSSIFIASPLLVSWQSRSKR